MHTGDSVGQAVTAGRRLFGHDGRPSPKGDMTLADWLVPVRYLRREVRFPQARTGRRAVAGCDAGPDPRSQDPLAAVDGVFLGRDDLFCQLETAARLQHVVVLVGEGKFFFTMMAAFAELERGITRERTMAGLAAARARGRNGGRPTVMDSDTLAARARRERGESPAHIARALGVSRASVYRHLLRPGESAG